MLDNVGKLLILNDEIIMKDLLDSTRFSGMNAYYEVIRIIGGIPLFLEDHIERLRDSLSSNGLQLEFPERELSLKTSRIAEVNGLKNCNVKITVYADGPQQVLLMYISKSYYPTDDVVAEGVKLSLMNYERKSPQIKRVNASLRDGADQIMRETGAFEILLVNNEGFITEGSKSNVFFIKGNSVYTSPAEYILKGVTRKYILEVCRDLRYNVIENMVGIKELDQIDGLFISGTSIKVLPVSAIEGHLYHSSSNLVISDIRKRFDHLIQAYLNGHKF